MAVRADTDPRQTLVHDHNDTKENQLTKLWRAHAEEGLPFFSNFQINTDGGFNDVHELFTPVAFLWAALVLICVLSNSTFLLLRNWPMIIDPWFENHLGSQGKFYATNALLLRPLRELGLIHDEILKPTVAVAFLEVGLLFWFVLRTLQLFLRAKVASDGVLKWWPICNIAWNITPSLSVVSGLQLLYYVHPQVLARNLGAAVFQAKLHGHYWKVIKIIVLSFCAGIFGFDAFLVKFHRLAELERQEDAVPAEIGLEFLVFLNQTLGVVQIEWSMRARLYQFMFAGADAAMTAGEQIEAQVWQAMLAKHIWLESQKTTFPTPWFVAVMFNHTEHDLQILMLRDSPESLRGKVEKPAAKPAASSGAAVSSAGGGGGGGGGTVEMQRLSGSANTEPQ